MFDYPYYSYVLFRHSIENTVKETLGSLGKEEGITPRFLIRYTFENEKFKKLWDVGFRYFCNVDSTQYWLQYGSNYMRQGRRNMDGQMMFKQMVYPEKVLTSDLFDVYDVFDRRRPLPVNGITMPEDFDLQALADSLGMSDRIIN